MGDLQNSLKTMLSSETPTVALSFSDQFDSGDIDRAIADGLDVAELRIDRYESFERGHVVDTVRRFETVPTIATIRTREEGGDWTGSDEERAELFRTVLPHVGGIDIELASMGQMADVATEARSLEKVLIVSSHDFARTPPPEDLVAILTSAKSLGADLVKVSMMAESTADLRVLAQFTLSHADEGVIVIAMGAHGSASRVFFPALGSRLTYTYASDPVPGQLTFPETLEELRRFYPDFDRMKTLESRIRPHT